MKSWETAMKSWDDYMDALAELPEWMQYRNKLRVAEMVKTAEQLAKYGVGYPTGEIEE